ncbi:MAG: DNA-3-methyladenine glycosylase [Candidatus Paracaedibacteraceae bacterium]|nr:DNA-3-methyladenine glycosylase [Candidatus Paracaedibacteraceae bacterium]
MKLTHDFFNRNCTVVAHDLIGKKLVFGEHEGIITETEAYRSIDDPASHAHRGITPRSAIMFGPPGKSYVYFIYGMYYCLNIVTEPAGEASAVLLRGLKLLTPPLTHLNGPGKLCRYLGITTSHNGIDLLSNPSFYVTEGIESPEVQVTPRIGIKKAMEKPWRFVMTL